MRQPQPLLQQVAPAIVSSAGGAALTIRGSGFQPGARVVVDGAPVTATWRSAEELSAVAPPRPGALGPVAVRVDNPDGQRAARGDLLRYYAGTLRFAPRIEHPAPGGPQHLVTGDLNGDGIPDLVASRFSGNGVSVYLGQQDGTLAAPRQQATGPGPLGLVLGDANRDGKTDVIVVCSEARNIDVLLGQGDGTLQQARRQGTDAVDSKGAPSRPHVVAAADLRGQGTLDLVTTNFDVMGVFLGNGDGSFAGQRGSLLTSGYPMGVALADLNEDGHLDAAVTNVDQGSTDLFFGNGDGTFSPRKELSGSGGTYQVAIADLNHDRHLDLLIANEDTDDLTIYLGRGDGGFAPRVDVPAGHTPKYLAVSDVDGDGHLDVIVGSSASGALLVLRGAGDGTLSQALTIPSLDAPPEALVVTDLDRDGRPDIAFASFSTDRVAVLRNTSR